MGLLVAILDSRCHVYFTMYRFRFNIQEDVDVLRFTDNDKEADLHEFFRRQSLYQALGMTVPERATERSCAANNRYVLYATSIHQQSQTNDPKKKSKKERRIYSRCC